jgi:ABC-2 type transport system ATP-binding protein
VIEVRGLTKRYGDRIAVDDVTFSVQPGVVTGFLGPNGSGKSTTMRLILGLDAPNAGTALVDGRAYRDIAAPLHEVGAMLEAHAIHTGRSARNHLRALAQTHGIGDQRVEALIDLVGLRDVARQRAGTFSLGMKQRLGIASSLLGDPKVVVLDEPVNGLDPEGIRWVRELLRGLAAEGKTVFLSSHMMSEMALIAERLVVIGKGRLIADTSVDEFVAQASAGAPVSVATARADELQAALERVGATIESASGDRLVVRGIHAARIGEIALDQGIALHELTTQQLSLEDAFMQITRSSVEFHTGAHEPALEGVA